VRIVSRFPQCRQLVRDVCFSNSSWATYGIRIKLNL
jgi:hypothetical protein